MNRACAVLCFAGLFAILGRCTGSTAAAETETPEPWPMQIPERAGDVPTDPVEFYRWVVTERARAALKRIEDSEDGLIYGAAAEDANVAWLMATAYNGEGWSTFYRDPQLLEGALRIMNAMTDIRLVEPWEQGQGHGPRFGLHAYANAVSFWKETGAVPSESMERWIACVRKMADFAIRYDARALWVGEYANPEFYTLSGLAAAWELTGEDRYRREAARTLRRYEVQTFPDGGVSYLGLMNAQTGYQSMVVKSVARYYELTQDPYAKELLDRYARYYHLIWLPAGIHSPSEQPWLKHYITEYVNPAVPDMLASFTGDGRCATVARVQAFRTAEQVAGLFPSFREENPYAWYNFHATTYACLALRYHRPVQPQPLPARWTGMDENLRGIRARWDDWMAFATSRRASMTLAGCLIADTREPFYPLDSGLLFFLVDFAETAVPEQEAFRLRENHFILNDWEPVHSRTAHGDGAVINVFSALSCPYWGVFPQSSAENKGRNPGAWEYSQAWITWKNSLFGMIRMAALRDSEGAEGEGFARMRPVFFPQNRDLNLVSREPGVQGSYGRLGFAMAPFDPTEDWQFAEMDNRTSPPFLSGGTYGYAQPVSPVLEKTGGTWRRGDTAAAWTAYWDTGHPALDVSDPRAFQARLLNDRAGILVIRSGETNAVVFAANLNRRWVQLQLDPDDHGWKVELHLNNNELPTEPGEAVRWSLAAFHTSILRVTSPKPLTALDVAERIRVTGGRWLPREPYPWSPPY